MAKNILFTNNPEMLEADAGFSIEFEGQTITIDEVRSAKGKGAFQVDALYYREDGTAVILCSIPNYAEFQGRNLHAWGSVALPEFPSCLLPYVSHYVGQTRDLVSKDTGKIIRNADGSPRKGHEWSFEGRGLVTSIQLKEGFLLAMVGDPEESSNQVKGAPKNYTIRMQVVFDEDSTFAPWSAESRLAVTTQKVEGKIRFNLPTPKAEVAKPQAKRKKAAGTDDQLMF